MTDSSATICVIWMSPLVVSSSTARLLSLSSFKSPLVVFPCKNSILSGSSTISFGVGLRIIRSKDAKSKLGCFFIGFFSFTM